MQFWRVAEKGRGPVNGCSMNAQLKMGYTVINSYYPETYVDLEEYMSSESLSNWHWHESPQCETFYRDKVIGSELCAWEYGNTKNYPHYDRTLPSAIFLFGDKLWNGKRLEYSDEYSKSMTSSILGASASDDLDVFICIGDVLPPRMSDKLTYPDKTSVTEKLMKYTKNELLKLSQKGNFFAEIYMKVLTDN